MVKKQYIKNILLIALWSAIGTGTVVLLVAAIQKKDAQKCTGVNINIRGVSNNFFVDKGDILSTIRSISGGKPEGRPVGDFNLKEMEMALQKNIWVKTAQLYFDNNENLQVNVLEREPIARVFTTSGATFYVDTSAAILPLSEKFSARLPVFTGFPSDKKVLLKADSNLLRDIIHISVGLQADPFQMAMIDQVDITAQRSFEMIPKFGNTTIVLGDARDLSQKLAKLRLFYEQVVAKAGWNKYSEINVQYQNQVVAKRKGAEEVKADSLRTLQLMQVIAENAERMAADSLQAITPDNEHNSTNHSIIQQSIERDDHNNSTNTNEKPSPQEGTETGLPTLTSTPTATPVTAPEKKEVNPATPAGKPAILKPVVKPGKAVVKPGTGAEKPAVLMPKPLPKKPVVVKPGNDY